MYDGNTNVRRRDEDQYFFSDAAGAPAGNPGIAENTQLAADLSLDDDDPYLVVVYSFFLLPRGE